jgi:isocitrate/isopropylmalate dehydrogenase
LGGHQLSDLKTINQSSKFFVMSPSTISASKCYSIASIPADGIGPEVVDAAIDVLKVLAETLGSFEINFTHYDWSSDTYKTTGKYIPDGGLDQLRSHDAILFGAVGAPGLSSPPYIARESRIHLLTGRSRCS